jgi:hypothetical protein
VFAQRLVFAFHQRAKALNVRVACASEKEEFIEVALANCFGLVIRQTDVLGQLARAKRPEGYDGHSGFFGEGFQGIRGGGQLLSDRNGSKTAQADGFDGLQVEIIFGKVNGAAVFRDERLSMANASAGIVELQARAAAQPDAGYFPFIQFGLKVLESMEEFATRGQERVD